MMLSKGKHGALALAMILVIALTSRAPLPRLTGSDHIDSPTLAQDKGADINDVYMFLDPNDNSQLVMILTTNPFLLSSEAIGQVIFDPNIRYRYEIENTGDARPDQFIDVRFSRGPGRTEPQRATITLPDGRLIDARTTPATQGEPLPQVIKTDAATGVRFFAGWCEDPFFLDNTAANRFVLSAMMNPGNPDKSVFQRGRDTYAGFNTLVQVLSVPVALLRGSSPEIGLNAVTQRQSRQIITESGEVFGEGEWITVDRQGTPLVNNGLIPTPSKNAYNAATTVDDANGRFEEEIKASLRATGTNDDYANRILDAVARRGDILRVKLAVPNTGTNPEGGFPNGRRLTDDVVDAILTLINNGVPLGDNVNANEVPFRPRFPFVADPAQPLPPGDNPDDRTRLSRPLGTG